MRSYTKQRIEFSEGTTLLAGDVGAGKSSVLLAVEFALFGMQRGEISGTDILRHGTDFGHIELGMDINGKSVSIMRKLKRSKNSVTQDSGWVEVNGHREQKTIQEMRAAVLEMLGYPAEYITKNPILFRYTVYTPQDSMKTIIFEKPEDRIVILRKLFGIDKYGNIRNNTQAALTELRALKREKESYIRDLDEKKALLQEKKNEKDGVAEEFARVSQSLKKAELDAGEKEAALKLIMNEASQLNQLETTIRLLEKQAADSMNRKRIREQEMEQLSRKESQLKQSIEISPQKPAEFSEQDILKKKEQAYSQISSLISQKSIIENETKRMENIVTAGICEFCGQRVADRQHYAQEIESRKQKSMEIRARVDSLENERKDADELLAKLMDYRHSLQIYQKNQADLNDCWSRKQAIEEEIVELVLLATESSGRADELKQQLSKLPELRQKELLAKQDFEISRKNHLAAAQSYSRLETLAKSLESEINLLKKEISEKEAARLSSQKISEALSWIDTIFIPLMERIEHAVMHAIQKEFENHFQDWFQILMATENLGVSVDRDFTPLIEQQGYQTEYQNLSGGEKTAVALAYRLALNKVINLAVETIKTKGIIILDEPTDGFSYEQIDRIRDVLQALNLKQMIIVSHEPKIDTFVNHIIRFYKEGHVSRAVAG